MRNILICITAFLFTNVAIGQLTVTTLQPGEIPENCENCISNKPIYQFNTRPKIIRDIGIINPLAIEEMSSAEPRYRQFIEFGDGYFSNNFTGSFVQRQLAKANATGNYKPVIITYGIYTPKPPTIISDFVAVNRVNLDDVPVRQEKIINAGSIIRNVGIVPSINSVIPSDLMTFAVPFKRKDINIKNGVLLFLYNNRDAPNELFKPNPNNQNISWITDQEGIKTTLEPIRGIGTNNAFSASITNGISSRINNVLSGAAANYSGAVVVTIGNIADNEEHNIFITLQTNDARRLTELDERSNISVKAIFVPFDKDATDPEDGRNYSFNSDENSYTENLTFFPQAHDPNTTSIRPKCVQTSTKNQPLTFTINISNEGIADVKTVWLRPRFFNGAMLRLKNISIVKATIGGKDRTAQLKAGKQDISIDSAAMVGKPGFFCFSLDSLMGSSYSFSYWDTTLGNSILLKGVPQGISPDNYDSNVVRAQIIFKADIITVPDNAGSDSLIADVCFDSRVGGMLPIYSTPRPGGLTIATNCKDELAKTDKCTNFWCKYWWIILLILLAILVASFYIRKKRPQ